MRSVIRWAVIALAVAHGLISLLGAVVGFGWTEVDALGETTGTLGGVGWLVSAVFLVATGLLLAARVRWWWIVGAVAVVISQAMILTSWPDTWVGTLANVVLAVAVGYGAASEGPWGLRSEYRRRVDAALDDAALHATAPESPVTEADLAGLPEPVADHVRRSGAVGRPRVRNMEARLHGRIRSGSSVPWMSFTGAQVNTYGPDPARLFSMDATMSGLPVDILHVFADRSATMRVRVCSLVTVADASGPEMDRAETVTLFNDICVFAPAALVDAPVEWELVNDRRVRATFTLGEHSVTAELIFDENHDLADFVSDDRLRASSDGDSFVRQRWSTPVGEHRRFGDRRIASVGEARWYAPDPEGEFVYVELVVDDIAYNVGPSD